MITFARSFTLLVSITTLVALSACKGSESEVAAVEKKPRVAIDTQELKAPCDWLTREAVAEVLGPLAGEPYRVMDAENVRPDATGLACAYRVTTDRGVAEIAVQMDPNGAPELETATDVMAGVLSKERPDLVAPKDAKRTEGWDFVDWVAGERIHRVGHVAIRTHDRSSLVKDTGHDRIAVLLREKIADRPFVNPGSDANAAGSAPDPCDLLTRAEAEAVLGPLVVAPYRSLKSSALADGHGPSCTYYTQQHRTLVVYPTYYDGKERFQMAAGLGSLMRSGIGGADEGDLLDGPWESATAGPGGALLFLQGDTLLQIIYKTSSTDIAGAAKLAALAMPRLARSGR